jgi:hypothetical protein
VKEVQGSALHALHGSNGPWPLFHRVSKERYDFKPSVTLLAYRLLRESMLPVVLPTRSSSPANSGYEGRYDARGTVLASPSRERFSVWTANRLNGEMTVKLEIPELAGKSVAATLNFVTAPAADAHNYDRKDAVLEQQEKRHLRFDSSGRATYVVPSLSVAALALDVSVR